MAYGNEAPSQRRSTKEPRRRRPPAGHVQLARNLVDAEYRMTRGWRRLNPIGRRRRADAWDRLSDELSRLVERLRGRSRPAEGTPASRGEPTPGGDAAFGGGAAVGGGQRGEFSGREGEPFARAEPRRSSVSRRQAEPVAPQSPRTGRTGFQDMVSRLPRAEREAFEDAVLQQLTSEEKWQKAYDSNALSMPAVAEYANNAYLREVSRAAPRPEPRREVTAAEAMENARAAIMANDEAQFAELRARWERNAPREKSPQQRGSGFSFPRENEMSDGIAFQEAARVQREWSTVNPRDRGPDAMSDAVAFNAVEQASIARAAAGAGSPAEAGESDPFLEAALVEREWRTVTPRDRGPDAMSDAVAFNAAEQATVARITAGSGESAPVRESDPFREAGQATQTWAGSSDAPAVPHLIGEAGHQVLGEQTKAVLNSDGTSSPSRRTPAVPTPARSTTASSRAVR